MTADAGSPRCPQKTGHGPKLASFAVEDGGEFHPKSAAFSRMRLHAYLAAHAFDPFADDRQPDPGAGVGIAAVQPLEHPENPLVILGLDPDAGVLDPQPDGTGLAA